MLEGYSCHRYYYNETKEEIKAKKKYKRDEFYAKWECNIIKLKSLNLKVPLNLKRLNLSPFSSDLVN